MEANNGNKNFVTQSHGNRGRSCPRVKNEGIQEVPTRRLRKFRRWAVGFENNLGMAQRDPLDRAFPDLEAVMLAQFQRDLGEGIIRREIRDRTLQRPRTPARIDLRAENKRAHPVVFEPILRL